MGKVYKAKAHFEIPLSKIMEKVMTLHKQQAILSKKIEVKKEFLHDLESAKLPFLQPKIDKVSGDIARLEQELAELTAEK